MTKPLPYRAKQVPFSKSIKTPHGFIRVRVKHGYGPPEIIARLKGQHVGSLKLHDPHGGKREVEMIRTDASLRRMGVGRAMYESAERTGLAPRHSKILQPLGERYVRGMGTKRVGAFRVPRASKKEQRVYDKATRGLEDAKLRMRESRFRGDMDVASARRVGRKAQKRVEMIDAAYLSTANSKAKKALNAAADDWWGLGDEAAAVRSRAARGRIAGDSRFLRRKVFRRMKTGPVRYSIDEQGNLIHHSGPEVHKSMVPPRGVRYLATHIRRHPVVAGGIGAAAAGGGGIYTYGSLEGTNLRANARRGYESEMDKYQHMLAERSKDPRYVHRGNQVYVRNRRWFKESTEPAIEQLVRENKRGPALYVNIEYDKPWGSSAATTYTSDKSRATSMTLRPGQRNSKENRARGRFYAVHEHQHVKDYAGKGKQKRQMEAGLTAAYRKHPSQGAVKDFFTGRGWKRMGAYTHKMDVDIGYGEGRADRAAGRRLGISPGIVSGYPDYAALDPHFGRGYRKGMGRLRS